MVSDPLTSPDSLFGSKQTKFGSSTSSATSVLPWLKPSSNKRRTLALFSSDIGFLLPPAFPGGITFPTTMMPPSDSQRTFFVELAQAKGGLPLFTRLPLRVVFSEIAASTYSRKFIAYRIENDPTPRRSLS